MDICASMSSTSLDLSMGPVGLGALVGPMGFGGSGKIRWCSSLESWWCSSLESWFAYQTHE